MIKIDSNLPILSTPARLIEIIYPPKLIGVKIRSNEDKVKDMMPKLIKLALAISRVCELFFLTKQIRNQSKNS